MSALASISFFGRTAVQGITRSPFVHIVAIASLALALLGWGAARMASKQLQALMGALGGEVEMVVYLKPDTDPEKMEDLKKALESRTQGQARIVSPQQALDRLAKELGPQGRALEVLDHNPLPWTLEVTLPPLARDPERLPELRTSVLGLPFVSEVDYGQQAFERLSAITQALKFGSLLAFGLVFLTAVVVVSATLQLAIYARREDIEIQKLVGATDRFVRMPFLLEGLLQGLFAAMVACLALWGAGRFASTRIETLFSFLNVDQNSFRLTVRLVAELLGLGSVMGFLGSLVAVRRFLRI